MSAIQASAAAAEPAVPSDAERGVFALLAVIQDPGAFAERLARFTVARDGAVRRLAEAEAREDHLAAREGEVVALKSEAGETLAVYRRELEDLARKRAELERLQSDLFEARAKMEADAGEARHAVDAKAAELKRITDGLEERERLAAQVFDQGTALQHEYKDKLPQLRTIAAAG
jgi:chromosome segregation ATPase